MAKTVRPGTRTTHPAAKASKPENLFWTLFADPIRASSYFMLHQKAEDMSAPDRHAPTPNLCLQRGSHPDTPLASYPRNRLDFAESRRSLTPNMSIEARHGATALRDPESDRTAPHLSDNSVALPDNIWAVLREPERTLVGDVQPVSRLISMICASIVGDNSRCDGASRRDVGNWTRDRNYGPSCTGRRASR